MVSIPSSQQSPSEYNIPADEFQSRRIIGCFFDLVGSRFGWDCLVSRCSFSTLNLRGFSSCSNAFFTFGRGVLLAMFWCMIERIARPAGNPDDGVCNCPRG